jgi:hypothetical protein
VEFQRYGDSRSTGGWPDRRWCRRTGRRPCSVATTGLPHRHRDGPHPHARTRRHRCDRLGQRRYLRWDELSRGPVM